MWRGALVTKGVKMGRTKTAAEGTIRVGSRVLYHLPWGTMEAEVIEDRGNIGWKGRRLMRILPCFEGDDRPDAFEVPLEKLTLAE